MRFLSRLSRTFLILLVAAVIALFGYQAYLSYNNPYVTQSAHTITVRDSYSATALILRDETVIPKVNEGTVSFLFEGVEKVTKDMPVAEIYDSYDMVLLKHKIARLSDEIAVVDEADDPGVTEVSNLETINKQILTQVSKLGNVTRSGVVGSVIDIKNEMTKQLSKKQVVVGQAENFDARVAQLTMERSVLETEFSQADPEIVTSPESGYFIGFTDGYESSLVTEYAENMTLELFDMFMEGQNQGVADPTRNIGKVITNYNWYVAYPIPKELEKEFRIGYSYDLNFLNIGVNNVEATVTEVISEKEEDRCIVIFKSNLMSDELASVRFPEIEIVFRSYKGLEVPLEAVRIPDGYQGVYIKEANVIRFRKIVPLYQTDEYIVSEIDMTDRERLQLFDTMFLSQKGVEEGKILE